MLLLDLYKFCESHVNYTRQHIARLIYTHPDTKQLAIGAGMTEREMASAMSKEFMARSMTQGYMDMSGGFAKVNINKRPITFKFHCLNGFADDYTREMRDIGSMTDDELFS
jgi:hypothetical protein